jgi:hypothetical protein
MGKLSGWELSSGEILKKEITVDELWKIFSKIFSSQTKKTTSYKFALVRSILENLYNVNNSLELPFTKLSESFARLYWNLVIKHGYTQGKNAAIDKLLYSMKENYQIPNQMAYDSLADNVKLAMINDIEKKVLNRYVLGALYADTEGALFQFDKKTFHFQLNPPAYQFMLRYQAILFRLNTYELTKFIQSCNLTQKTGIIIENIECITKRENLSKYRDILYEFTHFKCFYTEQILRKDNIVSVDHFIPWSFIHSDNLWNLVLTSNTINSKKSSKIPSKRYLEKLIVRNQDLIKITDSVIKKEMMSYQEQKLHLLHSYATCIPDNL